MCCERLLCARCAAPVAEAGCALCRAARAELHPHAGLPVVALAALVAVLLALATLLQSLAR
jgi:hypothetical protein